MKLNFEQSQLEALNLTLAKHVAIKPKPSVKKSKK